MQSGIYDKFVAIAAQLAQKKTVGNPYENVEQGPQVKILMVIRNLLCYEYLLLDWIVADAGLRTPTVHCSNAATVYCFEN